MKKILLLLALFALTFSCEREQTATDITTEIVNQEAFAKGKPTTKGKIKCDDYVAPPTDVFTHLWPSQEVVSVRELIVLTINQSGAAWRWNGDRAGKDWSLHLSRLACGNIETNQYFDFRSFIYRISISDSNGNVINTGCFTPICDVTSYPITGLIEGETYYVEYIDFPEAPQHFFYIEYY